MVFEMNPGTGFVVLLLLLSLALTNAISTTVNEGEGAYLICTTGKYIETKSAFYGDKSNPRCEDANALSVVQGLADGKTEAIVVASATNFNSACGVKRSQKLIINYVCKTDQRSLNTKQGNTATLTCPTGRYITVTYASYSAGNCGSDTALTSVQAVCQFQETCSIDATDTDIPGSTCASNKKESLLIKYLCKASTGGIYTRWGSNTCPPTARKVYSGIMTGGKTAEAGSGSNFLCLSDSPDFSGVATTDESAKGKLLGQELVLDTADTSSPLPVQYDGSVIQCAVCRCETATNIFTYPADVTCPSGWNREYGGYLGAAPTDVSVGSRNYVCLDSLGGDSGYKTVGTANGDGKVGIVEAQCGGNLCDFYTDNAELSCSVCSK